MKITIDHLARSKIPKRYWNVKYEKIYSRNKLKIENYFDNLLEWINKGFGLYLFSKNNSFGKTSISVIIGKKVLSFGKTVLFIKPDQIQQYLIEHTAFDEVQTYKDRILQVDLLILDDLNKEYCGKTNFIKTILENIVRDRMQNLKPILITSNIEPDKIKSKYSKSLSEMFKECMFSVEIKSDKNWREIIGKEARKELKGE